MNVLQIHPQIGPSAIEGKPDELSALIHVDSIPVGLGLAVDWRELFVSIFHAGERWIWTAESGEALDADIHDCVFTEFDDTTTRWRWFDPISLSDFSGNYARTERVATFDRLDYESAIRSAWISACGLLRSRPDMLVQPYDLDRETFLKLHQWIHSEASKPVDIPYVHLASSETNSFGKFTRQ